MFFVRPLSSPDRRSPKKKSKTVGNKSIIYLFVKGGNVYMCYRRKRVKRTRKQKTEGISILMFFFFTVDLHYVYGSL